MSVGQSIKAEITIELLGTLGCHLCHLAEQLLYACLQSPECAQAPANFRLVHVDIAELDGAMEDYATRIPVLRLPDGRELDWPFPAPELLVPLLVSLVEI